MFFNTIWPTHDETKLELDTINLGVQINGKIRAQIAVSATADNETILEAAKSHEKVTGYIEGKNIVKSFVVPKKLVIFCGKKVKRLK